MKTELLRDRDHVPTLVVTDDDLDFLRAVRPRIKNCFSCNRDEVWPTDSWGYSHSGDRRYLDELPQVMATIHELVLGFDPDGARFDVDLRSGYVVACRNGDFLAWLVRG